MSFLLLILSLTVSDSSLISLVFLFQHSWSDSGQLHFGYVVSTASSLCHSLFEVTVLYPSQINQYNYALNLALTVMSSMINCVFACNDFVWTICPTKCHTWHQSIVAALTDGMKQNKHNGGKSGVDVVNYLKCNLTIWPKSENSNSKFRTH